MSQLKVGQSDEDARAKGDALAQLKAKRQGKPKVLLLAMEFEEEGRSLTIRFDSDDQRLAHAEAMLEMGATDTRVFEGLLKQVASPANKEPKSATMLPILFLALSHQ